MPEYTFHSADPNKYERMLANQGNPFPLSDYIMDQEEWARILRSSGVKSYGEFVLFKADLNRRFKEAESNWFKRLLGKLYFDIIIPATKDYLTPKKLMWVLTNLDQLSPWMPNETWNKVLLFLDRAATAVYIRME